MKPLLNLREITGKFFEPLTKHPRRTIIASAIIGTVLYVVVDIGLAELIRQNKYAIHMLQSEQASELGPEYIFESAEHADMIKKYVKHLEQRALAPILRLLYPQYSPRITLLSASAGLEKATKSGNEEQAKEAIWQAGLASNRLYKLYNKVPHSPISWFKSEDLPGWLVEDLEKTLAESTKLTEEFKANLNAALSDQVLDEFEKDKLVKEAEEVCEINRKCILLSFLARLGYDNSTKIEGFLSEVTFAYDCTTRLAEKMEGDKRQQSLYDIASSENRRVEILNAMLDNDIDKVFKLLRSAIENAFKKRQASNTT